VVADALSRVEEVEQTLDFEALAAAQQEDEELQQYLEEDSTLLMKKIRVPGTDVAVFCDVSTQTARPFVTQEFRKAAFDSLHQLSHPEINATVKLVTQRYVWPSIKSDCRQWARSCIQCQRAKVSRHVSSPVGTFAPPSARFEHIHIDIIIMPLSEGCRYCLTIVDRYSRWPEAVPLHDQEASTVARALYDGWISRFGTPLRITTDQGRQFESYLFKQLNHLLGTTHLRTTAYHPSANGMVERLHRQLKAAIMCQQQHRWTQSLPTVLLGIRSAWKEDLQATAADMVYGQSLRLPGEFLGSLHRDDNAADNVTDFVKELRQHLRELRPTKVSCHGRGKTFVFKDLATSEEVFVRHDGLKQPLQQPYDGPYKVIKRAEKTFVVRMNGRDVTVSIDRLKPAYIMADDPVASQEGNNDEVAPGSTEEDAVITDPPNTQQKATQENSTKHITKSGRRVRFPDRLQGGFS